MLRHNFSEIAANINCAWSEGPISKKCLHSKNIGSSKKIVMAKKRNKSLPEELRECQIIRLLKCVRCCIYEIWWGIILLWQNQIMVRSWWRNANTSQKGNCTNSELWWLSGHSVRSSSVTTICDLARVSMSILTASNWIKWTFLRKSATNIA